MSKDKKKQHQKGKIKKLLNKRPHFRRPIKRAVREETVGGIVFRRKNDKVQFLMIRDAKHRWTLPKGHVEPGEKYEDTARREVMEETGLKKLEVMDYLDKFPFQYRRQDDLVLMTQHNYLVKALGDTDELKKEDWMTEVGWMNANDALEEIEYESAHKLFLLALKKIRNGHY